MNTILKLKKRKIFLWLSIITYTFSLQYAVIVYEEITQGWSLEVAGIVPRFILVTAGVAYIFHGIRAKVPLKRLLLLIPCSIIAWLIILLEDNPNKHIHIPEYVLMTWLLFEAIRIDYKGGGICVLVFLCSSCLGVVDEMLQGIHPCRHYGWQDMFINTASGLIGVLSIVGLRKNQGGNFAWIHKLKVMRGHLSIMLIGIFGTIMSCRMLFKVQIDNGSWRTYPTWLLAWNAFFVLLAFTGIVVLCRNMIKKDTMHYIVEPDRSLQNQQITATLWVLLPLTIMLIINAVVLLSWMSGVQFQ